MPFPVDMAMIAKTEAILGVQFPHYYIEKMRKDNGGAVMAGGDDWKLHPFRDSSDRKRLARTASNIVTETRRRRERPGAIVHGVAIAHNNYGDALVFLPEQGYPTRLSGQVHWWNHETGELRLLVDDFSSL